MTATRPRLRPCLGLLLSLCGIDSALGAAMTVEPPLLPRPAELRLEAGQFALADARIRPGGNGAVAADVAASLSERAGRLCGVHLAVDRDATGPGLIEIHAQRDTVGDESYGIRVAPGRILLEARHADGLRQGGHSLLQLLCSARGGVLPALLIRDAPRFAWRGAMLDSARHYQSPDFIKRFLDAMAWHRLNVLHWHLTDDQGWRLQIKAYPKLTEIGGSRIPAGAGGRDQDGAPMPYQGFYSQDEARDLVAYAARLGITVLPEIDVPGHATAALAAYPELGALPGVVSAPSPNWGILANLFAFNEAAFGFVESVLGETMAVFPSPYLHVGGDEINAEQWRQSADWPALRSRVGSDQTADLQAAYTERLSAFVAGSGRRLIGWDEILGPKLAPGAVVMSWRGLAGGIAAAERGHDTVLSPWPDLYLDNSQSDAPDEPPGRVRQVTLESLYRFDALPGQIDPEKRRHVLGIQANLWSEHIRTEARMAHMAFPRLAALAEVAWSPNERRDFRQFLARLPASFGAYRALDLAYADSAFAPRLAPASEDGLLRLHNQTGYGDLHYTLDGSAPSADSPRYRAPMDADGASELRVQAFAGGVALSQPRRFDLRDRALGRSSFELELCGQSIPLRLEDDGPRLGERAVFAVDIQNPCWIWRRAPVDAISKLHARVGQVPFHFEIGAAREAIRFRTPEHAGGSLDVMLDSCDGPLLARLPLPEPAADGGVSELPLANIAKQDRARDLCFRFAQHSLEPMWLIDAVHGSR